MTLVLVGFVLAYLSDPGDRLKTLLAALGCGFLGLLAFTLIGRLLPTLYGPRLLVLSCTVQLFALAGVALLGGKIAPPFHLFDIDAADAPLRAVMGLLGGIVGALLAVAVWRSLRAPRIHQAGSANDFARSRRVYLLFAAVTCLLYWPATSAEVGLVGYLVRAVAIALMAAPFLAGVDAREDRVVLGVWCVVLLVNASIAMAVGARSKAFVPVVLFCAGYIMALPRRRRFLASSVALMSLAPLLYLSAAVGTVRDELGRGGVELLRSDHVAAVAAGVSRELLSPSENTEGFRIQGVSRLLAWSNVVVPLTSPEVIPYRGFNGLGDEVIQNLNVARLTGLTPEDFYASGLGASAAIPYGFNVSERTSVEFGLIADSWSRGGLVAVLVFSGVFTLSLVFVESFLQNCRSLGAGGISFLSLPIAKAAFFDSQIVPLVPSLRNLALNLLVTGITVALVVALRRKQVSKVGQSPLNDQMVAHRGRSGSTIL